MTNHFGDTLKLHRREVDAEPFRQLAAELDAEAVGFSGSAVRDHGERAAGKYAGPQPAGRSQPFACGDVWRNAHG